MKNDVKAGASNTNGKKKTSAQSMPVTHEKLHELFVDGLKDIYWTEKALTKAKAEYEKFQKDQDRLARPVDEHFEKAIKEVKALSKTTRDGVTPMKKKTTKKASKKGGEA